MSPKPCIRSRYTPANGLGSTKSRVPVPDVIGAGVVGGSVVPGEIEGTVAGNITKFVWHGQVRKPGRGARFEIHQRAMTLPEYGRLQHDEPVNCRSKTSAAAYDSHAIPKHALPIIAKKHIGSSCTWGDRSLCRWWYRGSRGDRRRCGKSESRSISRTAEVRKRG